ncbi:hypothetical protein U9M48_003932 [Paspalum notatum var. saurae]|uniref:Reverse transcriptase zinc-binding domain-containing protein n=1 Tax=Paspalum notatum var. saurae TaxID=547442 RepID=A0AAQ3PS67_PASNO
MMFLYGVFEQMGLFRSSQCINILSVPQDIWRIKLPLKINIFIWYLKKGVLLTKDNLSRHDQNPFCRYFSGELTGSGYGPNCSEIKIKHKWSFRASNG